MWRLISLSVVQCFFLAGGQVFLKLAMNNMGKFRFSLDFFLEALTNWYLLASGICMTIAMFLWLYILKHFEFSIAYSITSISYIFGMFAAMFVFHETIPITRWLGVILIVGGVMLIAK